MSSENDTQRHQSGKKLAFIIILHLIPIAAGFFAHEHWADKPYIAICVALSVECIVLASILFVLYSHVMDQLSFWVNSDHGPNSLVPLIGMSAKVDNMSSNISNLQQLFDSYTVSQIKRISANTIPLEFISGPPQYWPFDYILSSIRQRFVSDCIDIAEGHCTIDMSTIPDISLEVPNHIRTGAFCTAVEGKVRIFFSEKGHQLLLRQYEAAKRLSEGGVKGFTRMFIFDNVQKVAWRDYQLVRDNQDNSIDVQVFDKEQALAIMRKYGLDEINMDFGRWSDNLLMEIRAFGKIDDPMSEVQLYITRTPAELNNNRKIINDLKAGSMGYEHFKARFLKSGTIPQWSSSDPHGLLALEAPDGPHLNDADAIFDAVQGSGFKPKRIAVYGLTALLIEKAKSLSGNDTLIDVIDGREYGHLDYKNNIRYIKDNWLTYRAAEKYDAVVGGDILCNINLWQTPLFFENLARNMNEGGRFVVRTTSVFAPELVNPDFDDVIRVFRKFDPDDPLFDDRLSLDKLSKGVVYETAWPTLHSQRFYDEPSKSLSFQKWNKAVKDKNLSLKLANRIRFDRDLVLTSMRYVDLKRHFERYFRVKEEIMAHSLWEKSEELSKLDIASVHSDLFKKYYRIIYLERNSLDVR